MFYGLIGTQFFWNFQKILSLKGKVRDLWYHSHAFVNITVDSINISV